MMQAAYDSILYFLFPQRCFGCDMPGLKTCVCPSCLASLDHLFYPSFSEQKGCKVIKLFQEDILVKRFNRHLLRTHDPFLVKHIANLINTTPLREHVGFVDYDRTLDQHGRSLSWALFKLIRSDHKDVNCTINLSTKPLKTELVELRIV